MEMNYILEAAIFSVIIVQIIKGLIQCRHTKEFDFHSFFCSSGSLNLKSTFFSALVTATWIEDGIKTVNFAISFALALIVIVDSLMISREIGRQAKCLNELQEHLKIQKKEPLKEEVGNEPIQVLVSVILGIVCSFIYFCVIRYL